MAAIGDAEGTVTMMQLCESLYQLQKGEKDLMGQIFEREFRREKQLEVAKKQAEKPKAVKQPAANASEMKEKKMQDYLMKLEEDFFKHVGIEEAERESVQKAAA